MKDLEEIAKDSCDSYYCAKSLNFNNVPLIIVKSIAENSYYSYQYACFLHSKNVPKIIIKSISKYYSYYYSKFLNFQNVPLIILKSAMNCNYYEVIEYFPVNKHLLCYMLHFDKRIIK